MLLALANARNMKMLKSLSVPHVYQRVGSFLRSVIRLVPISM
jgi:hypothetical protein